MKSNNRGFMLAEVIIVSSIIVTVLVTMYTGLNRLFIKYDELSRYFNVDAIYMAKNVEDYLIDTYKIKGLIDDSNGYVDIKNMDDIGNIIGGNTEKLYFIGNYDNKEIDGNKINGYNKLENYITDDYFKAYVKYVENDIKNKYGNDYLSKKAIIIEIKEINEDEKSYYGYVVVE